MTAPEHPAKLRVQAQIVARDLADSLTDRVGSLGAEIARDADTDVERRRRYRAFYAQLDDQDERLAFGALTAFELGDEAVEDRDRFGEAPANGFRASEALELDRAVHLLAEEACGPQCCRGSAR